MGNVDVDGKIEVIRAERGTESPPQELCALKQLHDDSSLRSLAFVSSRSPYAILLYPGIWKDQCRYVMDKRVAIQVMAVSLHPLR